MGQNDRSTAGEGFATLEPDSDQCPRPAFNRNELLWQQLSTLPQGCQVHDSLTVAATVQLMHEAESKERLQEIGRHLKNEPLEECDRVTLRMVYRQCMRAFTDGEGTIEPSV